MSRILKKRSSVPSIAVVVDGKDEKWYIEKVKQHHPSRMMKMLKIKPELPQRKKIQDLFDFAKAKLDESYSFVILIIDMDEPLKDSTEFAKFKALYGKYTALKSGKSQGNSVRKYGWMKNLLIIVNNPCLEYWYLLHFGKTNKFYADYAAMRNDLRKNVVLKDYEKSESYYNQSLDIYLRLKDFLPVARENSKIFDIDNCRSHGGSEMKLLFDHLESL